MREPHRWRIVGHPARTAQPRHAQKRQLAPRAGGAAAWLPGARGLFAIVAGHIELASGQLHHQTETDRAGRLAVQSELIAARHAGVSEPREVSLLLQFFAAMIVDVLRVRAEPRQTPFTLDARWELTVPKALPYPA